MGQELYYEYTLKLSSQFKKDLKSVKFDELKLDGSRKYLNTSGVQVLCQQNICLTP